MAQSPVLQGRADPEVQDKQCGDLAPGSAGREAIEGGRQLPEAAQSQAGRRQQLQAEDREC